VKYRILMSVEVEAAHDRQAYEYALKLLELLSSPMVQMAVTAEGIRLSNGGGAPIVHHPLPENGMRA
jgi:hypothetical protein